MPSTERVGCEEKLRTLIPRKPTEVLSARSCRQLERSAHRWVGAVLQVALDEVDLAAYADASRVEGQAVLSLDLELHPIEAAVHGHVRDIDGHLGRDQVGAVSRAWKLGEILFCPALTGNRSED